MFKKKNELPPWPKPPNNDQMLEDLSSAPADDPVFTEFVSQKKEVIVKSDLDVSYEQVKDFLSVSKQLEQTMLNLKHDNDVLLESCSELKTMADGIRQQAVDALK